MSDRSASILHELEHSILFEPDFPKRVGYTHDQWESFSKEAVIASHGPSIRAIERARGVYQHLREIVLQLGDERYEPAIPMLARLWRECAVEPVRVAAGHALFAMET